jgi:hypothetical protein
MGAKEIALSVKNQGSQLSLPLVKVFDLSSNIGQLVDRVSIGQVLSV